MLKKFALGFIVAAVAVNAAIAIIALTSSRDRDLSLPDTAMEFQKAVFGGNYEGMWELSAPEFRDGLSREQFITRARENAPPQDRLFDWTVLNETSGNIARTHTRVQLASGGIQTHLMMLRSIDGKWRVAAYEDYDGPWPPDDPPLAGS